MRLVSGPTGNDEERLNTDLTFEQLVQKVVHAEAEPTAPTPLTTRAGRG
jgi:hypothetical protein